MILATPAAAFDPVVVSTDNRRADLIRKFEHGRYTLFEGMTTVAPLVEDLTAWHQELSRVVPDRAFLPLPADSYHATLMGLWVRKTFASAEVYNQHNSTQMAALRALDADLAVVKSFRMRADVTQAHDTFRIELAPADEESTKSWHKLQNIAKTAFPSISLVHAPHMSIGYKQKGALTVAERDKVIELYKQIPQVLTFSTQRVCYFKDMRKFVPLFSINTRK